MQTSKRLIEGVEIESVNIIDADGDTVQVDYENLQIVLDGVVMQHEHFTFNVLHDDDDDNKE